ncbi:ABC-2 type transport system ATP-binding protein [Gracilibacillus ureilyticus]|uniref:ABC-2 type transport system ATP-binding protein n=1 Tax=Gracilibacillus ureilyticus TaxID=531814 RepID=A0A1H9NBG2_9BACI|nr:ABC transporter ATP-binding protein [Gracilibacillus ureilyticus]SER33161.1 ABC-2 type transport system ATP-binding protein [Gracilibacillus ureilyticus]
MKFWHTIKKGKDGVLMLIADDINKYYGNKKVLSNVSFNIPEGACYGLVGLNGAGKSTLIKIIASVIHNYSGKVQLSDNSARIGYVPQEISLEESLTASDNLSFFGRLYGLRGKELEKRTDEVLEKVGLAERKKDKVKTFSGGMKRRLNIGCAIIHEPNLIIMDEPTVGIDPQSRKYIFTMIEQFKKDNCTIIYASHYMEEIERICEEAAFIDNGKFVESGSVNHLLQKYAIPTIYVKGENCLPDELRTSSSTKEKNGGYLITSNNPLAEMRKIINFCKESRGEIERLELVKPKLEDIFFSLTGSQLRD